jgi:predicted kinase
MSEKTSLHFFCGKMAAGKSTLARKLAEKNNAILLVEDEWLLQLFPDEIATIADYVKYAARLKTIMQSHLTSLLSLGISVVMDFPANTLNQRQWFRGLYETADVAHILHFLDVSDEVCKQQLRERSRGKTKGSAFTTDSEFEAITKYFQTPSNNEGFNMLVHKHESQG